MLDDVELQGKDKSKAFLKHVNCAINTSWIHKPISLVEGTTMWF